MPNFDTQKAAYQRRPCQYVLITAMLKDKGWSHVIHPMGYQASHFPLLFWNCILNYQTSTMCWNHMSASLQGDDSMGYSVAKTLDFCGDQRWGGYKRKKTLILKVFMTSFLHDVSHEVLCQFSFHLANINHCYFTLIVRKGNYCHSKSFTVTWLGWGWDADVSGVCLRLPLPSTYLYWLIITELFVWGCWEECWNTEASEERGRGEWKCQYDIASLPPSLRD